MIEPSPTGPSPAETAAAETVSAASRSTSAPPLQARALAFYLPQYFPIPENDEWWGAGFTEWTNTARARRLFPGHQQPTLPADLGFYDLRVPETRQAQSDLARASGVEAFVYWHYWFGAGDRILERPFQEVLRLREPEIGFALAWANQSWTGIWHGAADKTLKQQTYLGADDDQRHFDAILPAFRDKRYFRVNGRPLFYIFRPEELPDAAAFVERWQAMARAAGLDGLYLVAEASDLLGDGARYENAAADGFDASVYMRLPVRVTKGSRFRMRAIRKLLGGPEIWPYSDSIVDSFPRDPHVQPCVYPNWDNTPRAGRRGLVVRGATPERFQRNVEAAVELLAERPREERLLWVKSWNEWAEGNHLEPDLREGHAWLRALRAGLS